MRLRIEQSDKSKDGSKAGLVGGAYRYWLDDLEVTNSLTGLNLSMGAQEVNLVSLHLTVSGVLVDGDFLTQLVAHLSENDLLPDS